MDCSSARGTPRARGMGTGTRPGRRRFGLRSRRWTRASGPACSAGSRVANRPDARIPYFVERTAHAEAAAIQDVGVDHRGLQVAMAEQLLHGADVVAALEQMGREAVAQRVAARALGEPRLAHRARHRALHGRLVEMMAALDAGRRVAVARGRREDPLPGPRARCARKLARERIRQRHRAEAVAADRVRGARVRVRGAARSGASSEVGKRRHAILAPLAVAHADLVRREVEILHAQRERFEQPQTRPIEQARHESGYAVESREHRAHLGEASAPPAVAAACARAPARRAGGTSRPSTRRYRKTIALSAWFCVDADTWPSTARWFRNAVIASGPSSAGCRLP